jgi:hypothetical protein
MVTATSPVLTKLKAASVTRHRQTDVLSGGKEPPPDTYQVVAFAFGEAANVCG